jgi:hypothetical protein
MTDVSFAIAADAEKLVELYCKALRASGMDKGPCAEEGRGWGWSPPRGPKLPKAVAPA